MKSSSARACALKSQRGLSLVEVMIAVTIALFLLAGVMVIEQSTRNVFGKQNQLTLLQDNERVALTIIADVIQQAGYFPDPTTMAPAVVNTPITGTYSATAPGDTLSIAYKTQSGDGVLNCSGVPYTSGGTQDYINVFSVDGVNKQLMCTVITPVGTTTYPLVNGVTNLSVLYGISSNPSPTCPNCVDTYLNATQVTSGGYWPNVLSVKVTLRFSNPLYSAAAGAGQQPPTFDITRIVALMNKGGVSL